MRRKEIGGDSEAFGITRYRVEQEGRRLLGHRLPLGDKANLRLPVSSLNSLEISLPFDVLQEISQVVEELRHLSRLSHFYPRATVAESRIVAHGDRANLKVVSRQLDRIHRRGHDALEVAPAVELVVLPRVIHDHLAGPQGGRHRGLDIESRHIVEHLDSIAVLDTALSRVLGAQKHHRHAALKLEY